MPALEGMHAPNNEFANLLPPAGYVNPLPSDVFRFNRVTPYYPADPCIRPNEGDLLCPPGTPQEMRNCPWMPAAGNDVRMPSDIFRFHKVYPYVGCNPCIPATCPDSGAVVQGEVCPCTHRPRYAPTNPRRHFDYRYPGGASNLETKSPLKKDVVGDFLSHGQNWPHLPDPFYATPLENKKYHEVFPDQSLPQVSQSTLEMQMATQSNRIPKSRCRLHNDGQVPPDPYAVVGDMRYCEDYVFRNPAKRNAQRTLFGSPDPNCLRPYNPSAYICRPVYNRKCPVKLKPRPYDLNYMYPKCVDRPLSPYFETPLYHEETPFIIWPSNNPDLTPKRSRPCRVPFSKHLSIVCPNWAPRVGPDLTMFLRTRDPYC
ncbi:hypothetical protein BgiBS90_004732 [Biomphalaria glabrata]|nr:hypothetical protein BgiBS90_004732 [Biomphalaria glabrata]